MPSEEAKAARTESLFREVNERIAEVAETDQVSEAHFICECDDPSCTWPIEASLADYDRVRSEPTLFIVKTGHADGVIERVVSEGHGYQIVEKDAPRAAETATDLDPRS